MNKKLGFIGCGNMGLAMLEGIIGSRVLDAKNIYCSAKSDDSKRKIEEKFGVNVCSNVEIAKQADAIVLAIKPYLFSEVISEIKDFVKKDIIIISIAAGVEIADIENLFGRKDLKVVRAMPNTPALVGEGMSAICPNKNIEDRELNTVKDLFTTFGKCEVLEEKYFHGFIALCGSSPAYVYMFIEAMGTAGIKSGISAKQSYKLAAQSVLGAAKMVLETEEHPAILRDKVCSPGGTTIEAVNELENNGFKSSIIKAMESCEKKSREMSK